MAADDPAETPHPLDPVIAAAAGLSGLTVAEAYSAGVRAHLAAGLASAAKVGETGPEAAPVFRP